MGKRKFYMEFRGSAEIEIDDKVIEAVTDEWRSMFYDLHAPEEIAEMVGRCLVINRVSLSDLDGWADQPNENAKITYQGSWDTDNVEEIKDA